MGYKIHKTVMDYSFVSSLSRNHSPSFGIHVHPHGSEVKSIISFHISILVQ